MLSNEEIMAILEAHDYKPCRRKREVNRRGLPGKPQRSDAFYIAQPARYLGAQSVLGLLNEEQLLARAAAIVQAGKAAR